MLVIYVCLLFCDFTGLLSIFSFVGLSEICHVITFLKNQLMVLWILFFFLCSTIYLYSNHFIYGLFHVVLFISISRFPRHLWLFTCLKMVGHVSVLFLP